ncbi:MAG: hydrogenase expression/formation protein HypE [Phycisphaerae bacterium]|nr:hydrogenase expression/formation protein HypE [Phycisphaerae bacterium]
MIARDAASEAVRPADVRKASAFAAGSSDEFIVLAHGGGGELTQRLIQEHVLPDLANPILAPLTDGAVMEPIDGEIVFTTDSYVVTPIEFPGGDIGRLAVCGTVNDLAVMGAEPVAIGLSLIIEEGLPLRTFDRVMASIVATAAEVPVRIVTGDTKVIERRSGDGLLINTAGIGRRRRGTVIGLERIEPGDAILINGTIADHGLTVMSTRHGIEFDSELRSDAAPLYGLIHTVMASGVDVHFMRDATRGGLAGVLADICEGRGVTAVVEESRIPMTSTSRHAAEMLGLDPLTVANEGKVVLVVAQSHVEQALACLRGHPFGRRAEVIGTISDAQSPLAELVTRIGGRRIIPRPYGEDLPRIC